MNSKVRHNGTDKRNPNSDVYQDIQSQNDYSTTQLNIMGYKGDALRANFCADKIGERKTMEAVTVAHTRECQEALTAAQRHGKKFFVMGDEYVTSDDMFKAAEINRRTEVAAEREKDEKCRVEYQARQGAALPIVDRLENELENNVAWLTRKELEVLLWWKGVPVSRIGNVANRQVLYQQFAEEGAEKASIPAPWTEINQVELDALRNAPTELSDTAYGRLEEQKKRDVKQAYAKLSSKEKETLKRRMAEMDEVAVGDKEIMTPSLTPM